MGIEIKSVLVVDGVDVKCAEILNDHDIKVTTKAKITKEELLLEIPNYEALVVGSDTHVTKEVLQAGTKLKVVGRAGAGFDNIDVTTAGHRGVAVINTPVANTMNACKLTCMLTIVLAREVVPDGSALKAGRWERTQNIGMEVNGKTLAVLGLGKVGRMVTYCMHTFGMKVIGFDPYVTAEQCGQLHITKKEKLEEIWPLAEYITLNMPLTDSTRNFINKESLSQCKKGVKIINVSHAGLINEKEFLEALKSGQVGGAALDVFEQEPPTDPVTREIIQHPAVIATRFISEEYRKGALRKEAKVRVAQHIAKQLVNLVKPATFSTSLAEVTCVLSK